MLIILNAHHDLVQFTLPPCSGGSTWRLMIDTNAPDDERARKFRIGNTFGVTARSLLLFALEE